MRAPHPNTTNGSVALIVAGNLIIIGALIMQYLRPQTFTMFVTILLAGGVVAYSGFWGLNPKRTRDATQNLADVATKAGDVVVKVRGRRRTDAHVEVVNTPATEPGGLPTTTVLVDPPNATPDMPQTILPLVSPVVASGTAAHHTPPDGTAGTVPATPPTNGPSDPTLPPVQPPAYPDELPGARVDGKGD